PAAPPSIAEMSTPIRAPSRTRTPGPSSRVDETTQELRETRRVLLEQARATLAQEASGFEPNGNQTLVAAVSAIEQLTMSVALAARERLGPDEHAAFVDEVKRSIASAVTRLAHAVR